MTQAANLASVGSVLTPDSSGNVSISGKKYQAGGVTTNALAWVKFTGSTGAILSSYNVSSITRASAGAYTMNFSVALSDANYAVIPNAYNPSTPHGLTCAQYTTTTTTSVGLQNYVYDLQTDPTTYSAVVFGN